MPQFDKLKAWVTRPAQVNAFYAIQRNQIIFPAGLLQSPFYDVGQPNSINYPSIGAFITHEITHGFDNVVGQFNKYGNL
ncbi:neprilysin-like [Clavelina lepadiformis]|uniref:neprilysin-like n=1 Tax=Clavelina lepadiformis TaxID=159417 RepID=UPI0040410444